MNRREFLKFLGVSEAMAASPKFAIGALQSYPYFNESKQYGNTIQFTDELTPELIEIVKEVFDPEIKESIPNSYRKYIDWIIIPPKSSSKDPLCLYGYISWKYTPPSLFRGIS